jgi:hypothetical protein
MSSLVTTSAMATTASASGGPTSMTCRRVTTATVHRSAASFFRQIDETQIARSADVRGSWRT